MSYQLKLMVFLLDKSPLLKGVFGPAEITFAI